VPEPAAASSANPLPTIAASQAPPVALDGFCVVTLVEKMKWQKADAKWGAIHRGRTYLFAGEAEQKLFLMNPDGFAPVLSGCDPVRFAKTGELVEGKRSYGLLTPDKRVFLFADEESLKLFERSPGEYAAAAHQAMLRGTSGNLYR
jgi:protein disulfide-isomerase